IAVLAQRLVRKVCPNCKTEYDPPMNIRKSVESIGGEIETYYRGMGCKKCRNTGYAGRIAVHELFVLDDDIVTMINENTNPKEMRGVAAKKGMKSLLEDGLEKVRAGIVPIGEVMRIANN
ncbi:MAG TPA: hypothetical protein PLP05_03255, partial [Sedimentisphaerales bacterium]|nr:hypothetical protein [Sedimentisphaerales bacterium]